MVNVDDKRQALQQLANLLQDNLGNRITHCLISGVLATMDAVIPCAPVAADQPPESEGGAV